MRTPTVTTAGTKDQETRGDVLETLGSLLGITESAPSVIAPKRRNSLVLRSKPRADQTELHTISIHHLCFFVRQSLFISAICLNWGVVDTLGLHIHRRYANIV